MVSKYYAVVRGTIPGIYTDWPTTQTMTQGYPGAIFKSFRSREEAETFMATSATPTTDVEPRVLPLINKTLIYTDGSYADNICGFGIIIITSTGDKYEVMGRVPDIVMLNGCTNNVAELYAIYVALSMVKGDVVLYSDSRYAISCLTSWIHDWLKTGETNRPNMNIITGAYVQMQGRQVALEYVKAHAGNKLNEEVDALANQGRLLTESMHVKKNGQLFTV